MAIEVVVPPLGESGSGAKLSSWLKKEGDAVKAGETLAEIETDKTIVEVVSPADGTLQTIQVPVGGDDLADGKVIALIAEGVAARAKAPEVAAPRAPEAPTARLSRPSKTTANYQTPTTKQIAATPLAERMAAVLDIDLAQIPATGGRVSKADVDRYVGRVPSSPATREADPAAFEQRALSPMRKITAARMAQAKQTIPHFYLSAECHVDALIAASASTKSGRDAARQPALLGQTAERSAPADTKLTLTDFIIRAVALAMREVPEANATWDEGGGVRMYQAVDVAVAVNTPRGLITPIVWDAASKPLEQIAREFRALTARARDGALTPPEYTGGTVTISNLGMYGVESLYAILNPPQSCIIGIGAVEEKPVVRDGQIAVGALMTCTLSADHRVIDGVQGAMLLRAFKQLIEDPAARLLPA